MADIARGITVRIEGATQGSGVLVERQGDLYTALTAWHVVSGQRPGEEVAIYTPDGREQAVLAGSLERIGAVDLALLRFRSPNSYAVAQRGALSSAAMGSTVYVAGFPLPTSAVPKRLLRFLESRVVADAGADIPNGYQLLYDSRTLTQRGMSGGAVLNSRGQLVAIHGQGETEVRLTEQADVAVKTGTSQGVPVAFWREPGGAPQPTESARMPQRESPREPEPVQQGTTTASAVADDAEGSIKRAEQKIESGDYQGAISDANLALAINPQSASAYVARGRAKRRLKDYQSAIADDSQALTIDPRNTEALAGRAGTKVGLGDYQGALADASQALAIDPRFAAAYVNRGAAKVNLGDYQGALADYSQALAIDPRFALAYHGSGVAKEKLGNYQGALTDFSQALAIDPRDALAYVYRGLAKTWLGDYRGGIADASAALAIDPRNASAHVGRGIAKEGLGDRTGACQDYARAIELDPSITKPCQ